MRGWIYRNVIFSFPTIFGGGDYIVTLYFHPWQYLVRGWIYRDIIFSLLTIFGAGVIISWHYIFTPHNIWSGVIISWHNILIPDNIWSGGDYIVTSYFHSWQYFMKGWLCRDMIFSLLAIFGEGVIISWHIFTPDNIWWGGDYIVTSYFHPWQYLVRGWLYRDTIFSPLTIFGAGVIVSWHHIFTSDLTIFCEGVIISWHDILSPDNIWSGCDYIVTLYFRSWLYLARGWLYRDIIFSLLTIFGEGWLYRDIFSLLKTFGEGVIISWHIFTPEDIWWGGDYIVTLQYHFWHFPRIWHWRWLYLNIFTIQIWLCSDTRVLLFISIYSSHETWGLKWLYLSMIPSLLLKLSVLVDMLMDCINSLWWTKICKKS